MLGQSGGYCLIRKSLLREGYLNRGLKEVREESLVNVLKMSVLDIEHGKCKALKQDLA